MSTVGLFLLGSRVLATGALWWITGKPGSAPHLAIRYIYVFLASMVFMVDVNFLGLRVFPRNRGMPGETAYYLSFFFTLMLLGISLIQAIRMNYFVTTRLVQATLVKCSCGKHLRITGEHAQVVPKRNHSLAR